MISKKKQWIGLAPACDFCGASELHIFIDGKTHQGPWGIMCSSCFLLHGIGLGTGRGQKYINKEKVEG